MRVPLPLDTPDAEQPELREAGCTVGEPDMSEMEGGGRVTTHCTWEFHISSTEPSTTVADEVERIMEHLLKLESSDDRLMDAAVGLDLDLMSVEISMSAEGATFEEGLAIALAAIRTAIHSAGGSTPDWPNFDDLLPHGHDMAVEDGLILQRGELIAS